MHHSTICFTLTLAVAIAASTAAQCQTTSRNSSSTTATSSTKNGTGKAVDRLSITILNTSRRLKDTTRTAQNPSLKK